MASVDGGIRQLESLLGPSFDEDPEQIATWAGFGAAIRCRNEHERNCPHAILEDGLRIKSDCPIEEEDRDWARSLLRSLHEHGLEPTMLGLLQLAHMVRTNSHVR